MLATRMTIGVDALDDTTRRTLNAAIAALHRRSVVPSVVAAPATVGASVYASGAGGRGV